VADSVASQTIVDGPRVAVMEFTNISDGTGESGVVKVNPATLSAESILGTTAKRVKIRRIKFSTKGMGVIIKWDGTPALPAWLIAPDKTDMIDFMRFGGLVTPPALVAGTGKLTFTTVDASAAASYSIVLELTKQYEITPT
jgi:hypothetical protein